MLAFDPDDRITVPEALEHPWLSAYHDVADEPECPNKFEKWRFIEELKTIQEFREALWNEIQDYRKEVRGVNDLSGMPIGRVSLGSEEGSRRPSALPDSTEIVEEPLEEAPSSQTVTEGPPLVDEKTLLPSVQEETHPVTTPTDVIHRRSQTVSTNDPVVTYSRRSSIMQPARTGSYTAPFPSQHVASYSESAAGQTRSSVAFPSRGEAYVVPARSRTQSAVAGGEAPRRLLRTLSTVSIHESAEGRSLADLAPIGKYIVEEQGTTAADAPASEMPRDFGIDEELEQEDVGDERNPKRERKDGKFFVGEQVS
ncbi:hypothetical protein D9758_007165 [Tetrapyrgos nigripes]|uniref:Uncharacterized protein n=1 Tax=Tetrapyrgos nigripes TaxID=182062 RepID=A0A8H5D1X7_9AGAR|nr:hypothetical protein D9758_007165 [Tetrapyrgos nigripes]